MDLYISAEEEGANFRQAGNSKVSQHIQSVAHPY